MFASAQQNLFLALTYNAANYSLQNLGNVTLLYSFIVTLKL